MGEINILGKFDINNNCWHKPISKQDMLTSLSLVNYDYIKNSDSDKINYVILIDGCRLENYSKNDIMFLDEKKGEVDSIIDYYKNKKYNTQVQLLLVDKEAPLKEESVVLANIINDLVSRENVNSVNIIGSSKGGLIAYNSMKYLINKNNKYKTNIYAYSSPYLGTIIASPIYLEAQLSKFMNAQFPFKNINDLIVKKTMDYYFKVASNSHMDLDIAILGGVPSFQLKGYDPTFLENIFSTENLNGINNVNTFKNICAKANNDVLKTSLQKLDYVDVGLCVLNNILFDGNGDGFVDISSSSAINEKANIKSLEIKSTHRLIKKSNNLDKTLDIVSRNFD